MEYKNPLLINTSGNFREPFGVGYLIIPIDVNRDEFVRHCLNTSTVSIINNNYEIIHNVSVIEQVLDSLVFPNQNKTTFELGSSVLYINDMIHNIPIITGTLRKLDEFKPLLSEKELRYFTADNDCNISQSFNPKNNLIATNINSASNDSQYNINVSGKSKGVFNVNATDINLDTKTTNIISSVEINLESTTASKGAKENKLTIKSGEGYKYSDEFDNNLVFDSNGQKATSKQIEFDTKKMIVGSGSEPALLGNKVVSLLSDILNACSSITTPVLGVPTPITNLADFIQLQTKLEALKSSIVFIE